MDKDFVSKLSESVGGSLSNIRKSIVLTVQPGSLANACVLIKQSPNLYHLSTVTGVDEGQVISVYYHFWEGTSFLTVKTQVPKADPRLPSIAGILPSAILYEAEVKDLLGVIFEGNPFMKGKLLLPENYPPEAPPPLRKEADPAKIRKMMGLE
jgi:NADH:ubiquinone oxidoreductase subunit C